MSYQIGKGSLYLGNVKWSTDNANVMLFSALDTEEHKAQGKTARNNFMKNHLTKVKSNVIWYDPNTYVDIKGRIKSVDSVNYCYYEPDPDILDIPLCCFVTNYEYQSANTTRLYLTLDTWQTYIYDTNLYQSYIERAIIPKSLDSALYNTLPEPISAQCDVQHLIKNILTTDEWSPRWVLHSTSRYESDKEYHYEGNGTSNTFAEYGAYIPDKATLKNIIKEYGRKSPEEIASDVGSASGNTTWKDWVNSIFDGTAGQDVIEAVKSTTSVADLQDHRNELIGLYGVPKWIIDNYGTGSLDNLDNRNVEVDVTINLNSSSLANGYTPRNKKLLSSVCRAYVLANRTGLKIPFKPELFEYPATHTPASSTTLTLRGIAMSTQGYMYRLSNYADEQTAYGECSYNAERRVGYDSNTGLNKMLSLIGAGSQLISAGAELGTSIATKNPLAIGQGVGGFVGSGISAIDQIGTKESHFGSNGDLLRTRGLYSQLHFYEVNPRTDQCQAIDNFFDMYGYTINRHWNIANYTNNRSLWNYVKTQNADLRTFAPSQYEQEIKGIFNNGVRIWHDYENFANYSQPNN